MQIEYFSDKIEIFCHKYGPKNNQIFTLHEENNLNFIRNRVGMPRLFYIDNNGCGDLGKVIIHKEYLRAFVKEFQKIYSNIVLRSQ